jgi:hypothetical protein
LTEADLVDDIFDKHLAEATLEPGEVSSAMMAEKRGVTVDRARAALNKAYRAGELTRRRVAPHGGEPIWVYRAAK